MGDHVAGVGDGDGLGAGDARGEQVGVGGWHYLVVVADYAVSVGFLTRRARRIRPLSGMGQRNLPTALRDWTRWIICSAEFLVVLRIGVYAERDV